MQGGKKKKKTRARWKWREGKIFDFRNERRGDQRTTEEQSEVDGLLKSSN